MPRKPTPCPACGKPSYAKEACLDCRKSGEFVKHGTDRRYKSGCRCDACRYHTNKRQREYGARRKAQGRPLPSGKPTYEIVCGYCDRQATVTRKGVRYCSLECAQWARRPKSRVQVELHRPPLVARHLPMVTPASHPPLNGGSMFVYGSCAWCDELFMALASDWEHRPLTCSKRCKRLREQRRHGKFKVRPRVRRAIYERDGWTCQLCFEPVDPDATDIWRPTLDHIVPQSHVLIPDHSPKNLRLAHLWCNSVRGDERYYTADDLRIA